ncbi:MAG: hypothetical protein ACYC0B_07875 [Gemmatimonadaceae bacterium]
MRALRLGSPAPLLALAVAALLAACGDTPAITPPPGPTPLPAGTWYLHSANGLELPAEIARRFIGVVDEQTILDSARLVVNGGGTYEQRYWTRVLHIGVLDRSDVVIDFGSWDESGSANAFTSMARARTFTVSVNSTTQVTSNEPMVFFPGAVNVTGVYRTTPAP